MCEIVEISAFRKTRTGLTPRKLPKAALTFVMVPNERLSRLRESWVQLKADIQAEADETPQYLLRR